MCNLIRSRIGCGNSYTFCDGRKKLIATASWCLARSGSRCGDCICMCLTWRDVHSCPNTTGDHLRCTQKRTSLFCATGWRRAAHPDFYLAINIVGSRWSY